MPYQKWMCEKCGQSGVVPYNEGADVISVVWLIKDSHEEVSPECDQPIEMIRCIVEEIGDD